VQNNQNLSAHARRRLNKRLKKEVEDKINKGSKQTSENPAHSDLKSNTSMTDESIPMNSKDASAAVEKIPVAASTAAKKAPAKKVSKPQVEEEKQPAKAKDKKPAAPKKEAKTIGPIKQPKFHDKYRVMKSTEEGYKGHSDNWFDDEKFNLPKKEANFDKAGEHDYYFNSYSSHHIHEEMLKDTSRTLTYQKAIEGNPMDFKDKIVLDIGCGTGILSIFAARAGAKHVYAVDNAEIALHAREIIKNNGLSDKITVYKGKIEEIDFPFGEGEVDIIISEWMGYFLLYESMLDCVLWARDKFLNKDTGKMLPDRAQLYVAAIEDSDYMGEKTQFWKNVYGVNMSVMTQGIFRDPMVDTVPSNNVMSDSCCILDLDLVKMNPKEVEFSNFFSLKMQYTDNVHALVSWFDTSFSDLRNPVVLTTSPMKKYTHWKQSVFYIERPLAVRKGDTLYGSLACR